MIECIPNFSEGQRADVIAAIAGAIRAVPGIYLLDTHSDRDHNRSVVTFAGDEAAVAEAAFRAVERAASLIDLNQHRGQHPRIGATDVLPFVPLAGATIAQAATLARNVGQRIAGELGIPVYLYGAAASGSGRELPDIRKGQYEGLRLAIQHDQTRAPDYGPRMLGPAGATAVGARLPLIAYNLWLDTADVAIARQIAKAVRGSSGGLRGVRALGLLVAGRAQVSLNLTDFRTTPVHRAIEMVAREAAVYGVRITTGELVGLIPEDALIAAGRVGLRLPQLSDAQILERQLRQVMAATEQPDGPLWSRVQVPTNTMPESSAKAAETVAEYTDLIWLQAVQALAAAIAASEAALARSLLDLLIAEQHVVATERMRPTMQIVHKAMEAAESLVSNAVEPRDGRLLVASLAHTVVMFGRVRLQPLLSTIQVPQRVLVNGELTDCSYRVNKLLVETTVLA